MAILTVVIIVLAALISVYTSCWQIFVGTLLFLFFAWLAFPHVATRQGEARTPLNQQIADWTHRQPWGQIARAALVALLALVLLWLAFTNLPSFTPCHKEVSGVTTASCSEKSVTAKVVETPVVQTVAPFDQKFSVTSEWVTIDPPDDGLINCVPNGAISYQQRMGDGRVYNIPAAPSKELMKTPGPVNVMSFRTDETGLIMHCYATPRT